jgi:ubiquinone/menaquinone biosynthesis C-methylase UbiE
MAFAEPIKNLLELGLQIGQNVADFGAGSGAYTLPAARVVAPGKVYAIDIQPALLDKLRSSAEAVSLDNIEYLWGDLEEPHGSKLADGSVEAVIISNLFFQIERGYQVAIEARRILRPHGKVLCIDWSTEESGLRPGRAALNHDSLLAIFTQAGFKLVKEFSAGDHHQGLLLRRGD